jgi:hypothetical protein
MKKTLKKIYSIALGLLLVLGIYSQIPKNPDQVQAQAPCVGGQTAGNLYGYLETDEMGYIYLSTESWNDDLAGEGHDPTSEVFSVGFDRQTNRFSGRGWSPYAGWLDFETNSTDQIAEFESMRPENDTNNTWGNLTPVIDVSNISYQTDPGGFVGTAFHGNETGDDDNGTLYGAGNINFSNLSIIDPACTQFVSLTLNGASDIYRSSCPVGGTIQINWASENVNNCFIASDNWSATINTLLPNEYQSGNNYTYIGSAVNNSNPQSNPIKITCTGSNGQNVSDTARISCGSTVEPPITGGIVVPTYQEV